MFQNEPLKKELELKMNKFKTALDLFLEIAKIIKESEDMKWLSGIGRMEDPPSAAIHCTIQNKEYMIIFQPTDLPNER